MVSGNEGEFQSQSSQEASELSGGKAASREFSDLLDAILQETTGSENHESLDLVRRVAKNSQIKDGNCREAAEELVRAILDQQFVGKRFPQRLVVRIAGSLMESPDAVARLAKLWREARQS